MTNSNTMLDREASKKFYKDIEYTMTKNTAKAILKTRKGADANMAPQAYLCKYVNEQLGVLGNCIKVNQI